LLLHRMSAHVKQPEQAAAAAADAADAAASWVAVAAAFQHLQQQSGLLA